MDNIYTMLSFSSPLRSIVSEHSTHSLECVIHLFYKNLELRFPYEKAEDLLAGMVDNDDVLFGLFC